MKIRIPARVARSFEAFSDWGYVPLWQRGRFAVRRVDPIIALLFLASVFWSAHTGGLIDAVSGALSFLLVALICLWFF